MAPELVALDEALMVIERDARALASGLSESQGAWRSTDASWSVAQCFDHLAVANRVYLAAMEPAAARALATGRLRRRAALPGLVGGWFVQTLEPPPKRRFKRKAPKKIQPQANPALAVAFEDFLESHNAVRRFLRMYSEIDLAGVRFPNPFIRGLRFSLATGLHVIAAHDRRHLWQGRQVRDALDRSARDRTVVSGK